VAKLYGVLNEELGVSERSVFLIDRAGKIAFTKVYPVKQVPDIEEIINAVRQAASIPVGPKIR
jgi:alkyl hydroperoxide reductase subunit AhpC